MQQTALVLCDRTDTFNIAAGGNQEYKKTGSISIM